MGDPDDRHAQLLAQLFDQFQNLRLNRHVQRRRRFICDQHIRVAGQSDGNHHPLAHAAGKLVGIGFQSLLRIRNANQLQQLNRAGLGLLFVHPHMFAQGFHDLHAHGEYRVQAGHRVLEHKAHLGSAHLTQFLGADL